LLAFYSALQIIALSENNELERTQEEVGIDEFMELFLNLHGGTEENYEKSVRRASLYFMT
jgi:hypothetical protein